MCRSVNGNLTASDINRANVLARNPHVKMFDPSPIHKVQRLSLPRTTSGVLSTALGIPAMIW